MVLAIESGARIKPPDALTRAQRLLDQSMATIQDAILDAATVDDALQIHRAIMAMQVRVWAMDEAALDRARTFAPKYVKADSTRSIHT